MDKDSNFVKELKKDCNRLTVFQVFRLQNFVVISFSKTLNYVKYRNYQKLFEHQIKSNKNGRQTFTLASRLFLF